MARSQTPRQIVDSFMVRARRIAEHSLIREQPELMEKLHSGTMNVTVTVDNKTGEQSYVIRTELPPEEAMESLASRVRPLTLSGDPLYFGTVLDALEKTVGAETLDEWIDLDWWREWWGSTTDASLDAQAYKVGDGARFTTDRKLMNAWLYGDLVHGQPHRGIIADLSLEERYRAAASGVARICACVLATADMIWHLTEEGVFSLAPEVFTVPVVVTDLVVEKKVRAYVAPVGTPFPEDLVHPDEKVWQTVHEALIDTDDELREQESNTDENPTDEADDAAS